MAESADKTPAGESQLNDSSDAIELTEEETAADADGDVSSGSAGDYDRQSMVKTARLEAMDQQQVERLYDTADGESVAVLDDARFSPEAIVAPPDVLVKKWRDGLPGAVDRIIGNSSGATAGSEPPTTEEMPQLPEEDAGKANPGDDQQEEELDESDLEEVEPLELDDDAIELDEGPQPGRARRSTPPPKTPDRTTKDKKSAGCGSSFGSGDPEMKGLVEELLEEEKQKKQQQELGPRQTWFKKVFGEEYLRSVPDNITEVTSNEVDFIEESLRLKKNSRILDLACGFGRHSIELAERGYELVGLDLSMPLLQRALNVAQKRSLNVKFIHSDMRDLNFSQVFDGCFVWNTSLGYFDDRTNLAVLQGLHRALKAGGRLLVDVINRDHVIQQTPTRLWWEGNGCIFLEETQFDHQTSTLEAERSYIYEDGTPPAEHTSYIRLYSVHELRQMLHVAGFKVLEVSGGCHYKGHFLGPASRRIIVLAEKRNKKRRTTRSTRSGTAAGSD